MADAIEIDAKAFFRHTSAVLARWKASGAKEEEKLSRCDAVAIMMGGQNDEEAVSKTASLHAWLLGYEFPSTLIVLTKTGITFVTSAAKAKLLNPFKGNKEGVNVEVLARSKDVAENLQLWEDVIDKLKREGTRIGTFRKEVPIGKVAEEWKKVYNERKAKEGFQEVDVGAALSSLWAGKEREEQEEEEEESEVEESSSKRVEKVDGVEAGGKVLRNRARGDQMDKTAVDKFRNHQRELAIQKQEDGLSRFAEQDKEGSKDDGKRFKKFESYKKDHMMPSKTKDLRILIDHKAQSILLPIYGFSVPFHIKTLNNVSKSDEGDFTYLRFNFIAPGQIAGKKEDVPFEDPDATFVRSMSFRSTDNAHFTELYREISNLKKNVSKEEAEKKELADVVEQDKLILSKGRPQTLPDVFPRPALDGKRVPGSLEIHQNGLRFASPIRPDQRIDVLFNNVKHLFYQPCEGEMVVLIHCHLKAPIMVGKKKTKDVQFYREASDVQFDETGNRKRKYRGGDEDEFELEQEERRRRQLLNREFKQFAQKIEDAYDHRFTVDVPYRELGFSGVPFRTNVLLQPTMDCLIHLSDMPFFVVTLAEIECVHLERVSFGLKNFDMVIIHNDFSKQPVHVNSIDVKNLDGLKEYLDSCDIPVTEGPVNLNWGQILSTIREDPYGFFAEGGWSFLSTDSDSEDGGGSDASASGSDFGDQVDESEVFDDESSEEEDGSDFGDSDEDSDGASGSEEEDESGEDWDELEKKAKRADDRREGGGDTDDDDGGRSSKKKGGKRR